MCNDIYLAKFKPFSATICLLNQLLCWEIMIITGICCISIAPFLQPLWEVCDLSKM